MSITEFVLNVEISEPYCVYVFSYIAAQEQELFVFENIGGFDIGYHTPLKKL